MYAYGEAARHLEAAIEVQEVLDPDDQPRRCDLLLVLCQALGPAGEGQRVAEQVAEEAFALAEALGDQGRAARAAWLAIYEGMIRFAGGTRGGSPLFQEWAQRLDRVALPETSERIDADREKQTVLLAQQGRWTEAWAYNERAEATALKLGGVDKLARTPQLPFAAPRNLDNWLALISEVEPQVRGVMSARMLGDFLDRYYAPAALLLGDRSAAERARQETEQLAERSQDASLLTRSYYREANNAC